MFDVWVCMRYGGIIMHMMSILIIMFSFFFLYLFPLTNGIFLRHEIEL